MSLGCQGAERNIQVYAERTCRVFEEGCIKVQGTTLTFFPNRGAGGQPYLSDPACFQIA